MRAVSRGLLWLGIATLFGCGDDPDDWPLGRPIIRILRFLQQRPQDPWALEFSVAFEDTDGDLGEGKIRSRVNGKDTAALELADVFRSQEPPIALDATQGELVIEVTVEPTPKSNRSYEIGLILEDRRGEQSNEPKVKLEMLGSRGN